MFLDESLKLTFSFLFFLLRVLNRRSQLYMQMVECSTRSFIHTEFRTNFLALIYRSVSQGYFLAGQNILQLLQFTVRSGETRRRSSAGIFLFSQVAVAGTVYDNIRTVMQLCPPDKLFNIIITYIVT